MSNKIRSDIRIQLKNYNDEKIVYYRIQFKIFTLLIYTNFYIAYKTKINFIIHKFSESFIELHTFYMYISKVEANLNAKSSNNLFSYVYIYIYIYIYICK